MYFIAVACIANIVLDYFFIGFLNFGPAGAALGTTISQAISVVVSLLVILKRKSIVIGKGDFIPSHPVMRKILSIGIPIALQDGLIQVAFIEITIIANRRGLNDAAAVGIVVTVIMQFAAEPVVSLFTDGSTAGGADVIRLGGPHSGRIPDITDVSEDVVPDGTGDSGRITLVSVHLYRGI